VEQAPLPTPSSTRAKTLGRVGIGVTLGLTAASLGGFWYGRHFLNERLSPLVEAELQKTLKRTVKLGKVERVSLNGVQFGRSEIPATDKEKNFLVVDAVDVRVDALRYLQTSKVGVDVTIKKPQVFLKQDVATGLYFPKVEPGEGPPGEPPPIELKTIEIEDGRVTLQPGNAGQLVTLDRIQLQSDWRIADPNNQSVRASGGGKVVVPRLAVGNTPPIPALLAQAIEQQREDSGNVNVDTDWNLSSSTGNIQVRSQNLAASSLQGLIANLPITPVQGRIDSDLNIGVRPAKTSEQGIDLRGTVKLKDVSIQIPNLPKQVTKVAGNIQLDGDTTTLQNISGNYGTLAVRTGGTVSKTKGFNLDATLEPTDIAKALQTFAVKPPVAIAGEVKGTAKIVGKNPVMTAAFTATKPITVDRLSLSQVEGRVKTKDFTTIEFSRIKAKSNNVDATIQGEGQLRLPTAKKSGSTLFAFNVAGVDAEKVAKLYEAKLPAAIGSVDAAVQVYGSLDRVQVLTQFDARNAAYPAIGELLIANNVLTVRNTTVQFPAGAAAVNGSIDLTGNRAWQAQLTSDNIPLSALAPNQRGRVSGTVALTSTSGSFELDKIAAEADLNFANAVAAIPDAIATKLTWDGKSLYVPSLQVGDYLTAKGRVDLVVNAEKVPTAVSGIDLDLTSRNLSLSQLSAFVPSLSASTAGTLNFDGKLAGELDRLDVSGKINLQGVRVNQLAAGFIKGNANLPTGTANFSGNVRGAVTSPRVEGNLQLADLKFNRIAFESRLAGPLSFDLKQGLNLDLQGNSDRIAAKLDRRFQPLSFDVKLAEATATGRRSGDRSDLLDVAIENFPMAVLANLAGQSNVDGKLSSQLAVSLGNNPSAVGDVEIERLRYGRAQAERLVAKVNYANGSANITDGKAILSGDGQGQGEYTFNLAVTPQAETQLKGQVKAVNGNIQDIFTALQWFDFNSLAQGLQAPTYAKAADVQPLKTIGVESSPLAKQLEYFSQLNARIEQQETIAANSNNNLPPLSEFKGLIDGTVNFSSSQRSGFGVSFDIKGKQWEYGKLAVDDVSSKGQFRNSELKLDKLRFSSGNSFGQIVEAKVGLAGQSGKIELSNFPIESLRSLPVFTNIPVDVAGNANGTATIGGNLFNPKATGEITLADATINRQALESVGGSFDYNNGRFKFKSLVSVSGKEPLNISGDVPYRLPFALVSGGNALKLDIDVKDEGLAFINILNQPVRWLDGKGKAMLAISGTTRRPQVKGQLVLEGASVQVAGMPGDVTDLKGNINFDFDRLQSDLTGNFSDGKLTAKGILAIADPSLFTEDKPEFNNPLTLYAERLKLELKDLYSGGTNGFVVVRGAALAPVLSGEIALSNGRIILGGTDNLPITAIANANENANEPQKDNSESNYNVGFNQLIVKLRDNVQITRAPLLNFLVEGDVRVNGTLADIRPSGKINIVRGQLNAISARFRLDRAYENYAEFIPDQGLNPKLNVRLLGSIPEVTRAPISAANTPLDAFANPASTPVSIFGAQRTLQVQATLSGYALNIRPEDIDLRSSPPRTKAELLALIGGGLLQQVAGDPAAALANLAGGTAIAFIQDAIGDALNLSEFNLSPTTTTPVGGRGTTLGLAAEAAIDISRSFSVSVRSVLNDPSQLTNYTLRYRLNPNTLIRTNTDLKGNNGASVEFETRF
jgi:translocation and assembly module TamB